jgi:hypothetical protein
MILLIAGGASLGAVRDEQNKEVSAFGVVPVFTAVHLGKTGRICSFDESESVRDLCRPATK